MVLSPPIQFVEKAWLQIKKTGSEEPVMTVRKHPWSEDIRQGSIRNNDTSLQYTREVEFHAQMRLENIIKFFHVVIYLKHLGKINSGDSMTISGGAQYHMGKGSTLDRTAAAHKLPCPIPNFLEAQSFGLMCLVTSSENCSRLNPL